MEHSKCYLEVEIIFKNNKKEWISPIEDIQKDIKVNDNTKYLEIYNGYYKYTYNIGEIKTVSLTKILDDIEIERELLFKY